VLFVLEATGCLMPWKGVGGKGGGYSPNMIESYSNRFSGDRFAVGFLAVRRLQCLS